MAKILNVSEDSVRLWEKKQAKPTIKQYPSITQFLGYSPIRLSVTTLAERIKLYRYMYGLSYKGFACLVGVNASTVRAWELIHCVPNNERLTILKKLLGLNSSKS